MLPADELVRSQIRSKGAPDDFGKKFGSQSVAWALDVQVLSLQLVPGRQCASRHDAFACDGEIQQFARCWRFDASAEGLLDAANRRDHFLQLGRFQRGGM